jgi:Tfp pilus assembly protein PilF
MRWLRRFGVFAALLLVLGAVGGYLAWHRSLRDDRPHSAPPPDPRRTYTGPFLNIHPDVAYVGDAACRDCHVEETRSYREHPMGRSLAPIREFLGQIPRDGIDAGFYAFRSRFTVERRGERVWHRQTRLDASGKPIYTLESEVQFAIGSGTRGYSFLSDRDGYLFQTPISWFSQKHIWGLSPGFSRVLLSGRPIGGECLYCHANRVRPQPDTMNGFETPIFDGHAIGCERCHGPGGRHVLERNNGVPVKGTIDYTIFNPSKKKHKDQIEPAVRDAVCEQCHLSGEVRVLPRGRELFDFRPGLRLQAFWSVFIHDYRAEGKDKAVNHVVQMHLSRCYRESTGQRKLECVSCHNPHEYVSTDQRISYYRARCLNCHESHGCAMPREQRLLANKEDSCIDCHMPRYSATDIPHTAATDHRIVRRPDPVTDTSDEKQQSDPLKPFYEENTADTELARDKAVALMRYVAEGKAEPRRFAQEALDLLTRPLAEHPDDVPAWRARGAALSFLGINSEALSAYEKALEYDPGNEEALLGAARHAENTGQPGKAIDYWRRAIKANPLAPAYHGKLAQLLEKAGYWQQARDECRTWLRLDPGNLEARKLLIRCLRQLGERKAASEEMDQLRRLDE